MKGDFTRDTFDPRKHFSRVLMQQGRVSLDADFNEQAAILLGHLRTLGKDVIGPFAAPIGTEGGFDLRGAGRGGFEIGPGRYYVEGLLVENGPEGCAYALQPDYPLPEDDKLLAAIKEEAKANRQLFLVYLDAWERHITPLEDDAIREKALGGPDTCTRARVVWQVKSVLLDSMALVEECTALERIEQRRAELQAMFETASDLKQIGALIPEWVQAGAKVGWHQRRLWSMWEEVLRPKLVRGSAPLLAACVETSQRQTDPCVMPPASKYRGAENHLYRVEIHRGGKAGAATFKWSRDNGSVAARWLDTKDQDLRVSCTRGFVPGNWVELSEDGQELLGRPGTMVRIVQVEGDVLTVEAGAAIPARPADTRHPTVRRWDQVETEKTKLENGAVPVRESPTGKTIPVDVVIQPVEPIRREPVWIALEDGVQVQFLPGGEYRTGDYWLIPARVATGGIEWPASGEGEAAAAQGLPPFGVAHHYAPLGFVACDGGKVTIGNLGCQFAPLLTVTVRVTAQAPVIRAESPDAPTRRVTPAPGATKRGRK